MGRCGALATLLALTGCLGGASSPVITGVTEVPQPTVQVEDAEVNPGLALGRAIGLQSAGTFFGGVVADEPQAAAVARNVLSSGGTAADATVALGFALSVTLPSRVGLGGGGLCLVRDAATRQATALEFLAPAAGEPAGGPGVAVPALAQGMAELHARFGTFGWARLVEPARDLARDGVTVAPIFAADLSVAEGGGRQDASLSQLLDAMRSASGDAGTRVRQPALADLLDRIVAEGPAAFAGPDLSAWLADQARTAGVALSAEALSAYRPQWHDPVRVTAGPAVALFSPPPVASGLLEAEIWSLLLTEDRYASSPSERRPHLVAEVSKRALADRGRWLSATGEVRLSAEEVMAPTRLEALMSGYQPGRATPAGGLSRVPAAWSQAATATGFIVVDRFGSAVVCGASLHGLFGARRMLSESGLILAAAPGPGSTAGLGPMIALTRGNELFLYGAIAVGGGPAAAAAALVGVGLQTMVDNRPLDQAVAAHRAYHTGRDDVIVVEPGISQARVMSLSRRGHRVTKSRIGARVNAVHCPGGLPREAASCTLVADPRLDRPPTTPFPGN